MMTLIEIHFIPIYFYTSMNLFNKSVKFKKMLNLPILTKEKFILAFFMWVELASAIWAMVAWFGKGMAAIQWQLYDMLIGVPP